MAVAGDATAVADAIERSVRVPPPAGDLDKLDLPALLVAMATAALAGATDIYGFVGLNKLFVSFMSGNTTMMALALGEGRFSRVGLFAGIIALFVTGAAMGTILGKIGGHYHAATVGAAVTLLLAIPLFHDPLALPSLVLAMGALNATLARIGDTGVGLVYVTGGLAKLGGGIGRWLLGIEKSRGWLVQAPIWLSLFFGAVAGALIQTRLGGHVYWPLPAFAALLVPFLALWGRAVAAAK